MEYFPIHTPCLLETLPTMALLPQTHGELIHGVCLLSRPLSGYLTFCDRLPSGGVVNTDCTSTILVPPELEAHLNRQFPAARLISVGDPRAVFIDTLDYLQRAGLLGMSSVLPKDPRVSPDATIGAHVVIEAGVQIDAGATVGSGAVILRGTWVQSGVIVGANSVLGSTGINAYAGKDGKRRGFPHLAGVIVGDGASLGASCVVMRGILSSTQIGAGSIIGNLCNIGHGVEIGENVWMAAGTVVGGHTKIEDKATIALGCMIRDNITVGAAANIGMGSVVTKSVRPGVSKFGNPARPFTSVNAGPSR